MVTLPGRANTKAVKNLRRLKEFLGLTKSYPRLRGVSRKNAGQETMEKERFLWECYKVQVLSGKNHKASREASTAIADNEGSSTID
ncbi:hypothetical protein RRG08_024111 [Elysia crispata]|uniref:Uncharacterized protein n=1 Tax=Elysia crispata TaxID=231223 RepID=A0AAE1BBF0_9GAST|nr:hypothetical protein RRG08_024111 [Elysia crispata]